MSEDPKLKVEFAPGCFDSFEGTQEELDELMTEIHRMIESGELFDKATPVDFDQLIEDEPEYAEKIMRTLGGDTRNLQ